MAGKILRLEINDNPNTGACDIVDHFKAKWFPENEKLRGIEIDYNNQAEDDSIVLYEGLDVLEDFLGNEALIIGDVEAAIFEHLGVNTSWDDFVAKYGI